MAFADFEPTSAVGAGLKSDGTYEYIKTDDNGNLKVNVVNEALNPPNANAQFTQKVVTTTAAALITTPLTNRRKVTIHNLDSAGKSMYVGVSGVTATTGFVILQGQTLVLNVTEAVVLFAISVGGSTTAYVVEEGL